MILTVVLATRNANKVAEIRAILEGTGVSLIPVTEIEGAPEVEETGETLEANAVLKAGAIARASGRPALADDTGLEVDALGGDPGVRSARFAGPDATYRENCEALLRSLATVPPPRTARFRTVVALATPEGRVDIVSGTCEGVILEAVTGGGGFGYDPLFAPEGDDRSFAEMSPEEKNAVSHRGRAFRAAREMVRRRLSAG